MYKNPDTRDRLQKPDDFLGDIAKKEYDKWPQPADAGRADMLRECPAYMTFCEEFVRPTVTAGLFKSRARKSPLSEYMSHALEAFMVILYVNNHTKWMAECEEEYPTTTVPPSTIMVEQGAPRPRRSRRRREEEEEEEEDLDSSEDSLTAGAEEANGTVASTSTITGGWTHGARGSGLHGGWSEEAFELYNHIVVVLIWQRKPDNNDERIKDLKFEETLLERFQQKAGGVQTTRQGRKKRVRPLSNIADFVIDQCGRWDSNQAAPELRAKV